MNIFTQSDDLSRTIGLNSHYVGTLTFDLEEEDMEFLNKVKCDPISHLVSH